GITWNLDCKFLHECMLFGSWANQAHVAEQHVHQLWDLVEPALTQETPKARDSNIVLLRELNFLLFALDHGPELPDPKRFAVPASPRLAEQGGARGVHADGRRHQQPKWHPEWREQHNQSAVGDSLDCIVGRI